MDDLIATSRSDAPRAVIRRVGRWKYNITVRHDVAVYGPGTSGVIVGWFVYGRKRAEAKARRVLHHYVTSVLAEVEELEIWEDSP